MSAWHPIAIKRLLFEAVNHKFQTKGIFMGPKARAIAMYLPQFHPIRENNEWWGPGFTEWTNTARARPFFRGHYQPHVPADLGYYDLRLPETRMAQADVARHYGIEAFCYYHYWFAGRRILERPFSEVLASKQPNFGFCLCWANQSWTGVWHGLNDRILIEQTYPGEEDHRRHFDALLPAFLDPRYFRIEGRPLFVVFRPEELPDPAQTTDLWRKLALEAGLPGLYLVCEINSPVFDPRKIGFDASIFVRLPRVRRATVLLGRPMRSILDKILRMIPRPTVYQYDAAVRNMITTPIDGIRSHPCVIPNWDNTPRSGARGLVLHRSTPEGFRRHLRHALRHIESQPPAARLLFIKSWNEWAEGNHLEPDIRSGHAYLQVLREELMTPLAC
jgi:lipopolysaccharide biosynthesis protein